MVSISTNRSRRGGLSRLLSFGRKDGLDRFSFMGVFVVVIAIISGYLVIMTLFIPDSSSLSSSSLLSFVQSTNAVNGGYRRFLQFKQVARTEPLPERYITLWLHQVHRWFGAEDGPSRYAGINRFLQQAKDAGFTSVMTDLPWEWTERNTKGELDLNSVNKDWMGLACKLGLQLQVVISMRELPPWMHQQAQDKGENYFEQVQTQQCFKVNEKIQTPSPAHPIVWQQMLSYTTAATRALLVKYGTCIKSISPTLNNEFETRFSQTNDVMRDYSPSAIDLYKKWQVLQGLASSMSVAQDPNPLPCAQDLVCKPYRGDSSLMTWLEFREEFLANRYITLCKAVKEASSNTPGLKLPKSINCFLHIGEMLATTDFLNSNAFFRLARSDAVDELVMDSNMMLSGAPGSPSVVGLMVSVAHTFPHKTIHYELATERVIPCGDDGKPLQGHGILASAHAKLDQGAPLLLRTGVQHALEASIDSLGVTNLCQPNLAEMILPLEGNSRDRTLNRSPNFAPTAILFVPYRAFYAFSMVVSGRDCGHEPLRCWHSSFDKMTFFGRKGERPPGTCPVDVFQRSVLEAWDDLRLRHEQVAVFGDVQDFKNNLQLLSECNERVIVRFPCLMNGNGWNFFNGQKDESEFQLLAQKFSFREHIAVDAC